MAGQVNLLDNASKTMHGLLSGVSKDQLDESTPCPAFDVRKLVNHIVGGTVMFGTVVAGTSIEGTEPPDFTGGDFAGDYVHAARGAVDAFNADGAMDRDYQFPFGEMSGPMTFHILLSETLVHGWDLAKSTGQSFDPDPEIVQASYNGANGNIPDEVRGPDKFFGPAVPVPDSAPLLDRLLGYMGRDPAA